MKNNMSSNTYKKIFEKGKQILKENDIENYELDSFLLLEFVFDINRSQYFLYLEDKVENEKEQKYFEYISKRAEHYPLQYITGIQGFMDCVFEVNENVLIPRQDTELLVEKSIETVEGLCRKNNRAIISILDMCTGSGCIAISIQKYLSQKNINSVVTAVDVSEQALLVAKKNNEINNTNVNFIKSDLFEGIKDKKFDIIISNPPYIEKDVIPTLMEEVKNHEPMLALDGGNDGLDFYKKIILEAKRQNEEYILLFEIGHNQGIQLEEILSDNNYNNIEIFKDLAGLDRVVRAEYKC